MNAIAPITAGFEDVALALDPTLIMRKAGLEPDPWQSDLLLSPEDDWWLVLCSRQSGKTTTVAVLALHTAMVRPGTTVLIVTPSENQSKEVLRSVSDFYFAIHGAPVREDTITALKIELGNRSRILALSGADDKFLRVHSNISLIVADEGARIAPEIFHTIAPMLAVSGGRMVLTSTPWFMRGFMYDAWKNGGDDWRRIKVKATDCPRISPEFLERERRSKPAAWFAQEYMAEWGSVASALFPMDLIQAAMCPDLAPYAPDRPRFI